MEVYCLQNKWNPGKLISKTIKKIEINKDIILYVDEPFENIIKLSPKYSASWQRSIVDEWVKEFTDAISQEFESFQKNEKKEFEIYFGEIFLGKFNSEYYILDGQHRYESFKRFYEETEGKIKFSVPYKLRDFKSKDGMVNCFQNINKRYDLTSDIKNTLFTDTRSILVEHLNKKYGTHIKLSKGCQFPNIHIDSLIPILITRLGDDNNNNNNQLIEKFEQLNQNIGEVLQKKDIENYNKAISKQGLFLGVLLKKSHFEKYRKGVPKTVRFDLFHNKFGINSNIGECDVCKCQVL